MPDKIKIAGRWVGEGESCFVTAEVGINHNGDVEIARKLVAVAVDAGCNAVKFQKRTVDLVYSSEELSTPRESPFGATNGDLKRGLEFGEKQYREIDLTCRSAGIPWFASCWDGRAVDFIEAFNPPCYKIASASLTDDGLLKHHRKTGKPILLSTGMSTLKQIDHAVDILGTNDLLLLHTTSTYPLLDPREQNLRVIHTLKERYKVPVGYSGHEVGIQTSVAAAVMGACMLERHITLERAMWGSDQPASLEPQGIRRLVRDIREVEAAMGDGVKRVYDSEIPVMKKLRKVG